MHEGVVEILKQIYMIDYIHKAYIRQLFRLINIRTINNIFIRNFEREL